MTVVSGVVDDGKFWRFVWLLLRALTFALARLSWTMIKRLNLPGAAASALNLRANEAIRLGGLIGP